MFTIDKKLFSIPFFLTIFRIVIIPFLVVTLLYHQWHAALCLFTLAAMSDVLDGAFARLFNEETTLGAFLDPIGDKILTLTTFGILAFDPATTHLVPTWLFFAILTKELVLTIGAIYLMRTKPHCVIHAGWAGKAAMFIQTVFIFIILLTLFAEYQITNMQTLSFMHWTIIVSILVALGYYVYQFVRCRNSIVPVIAFLLITSCSQAKMNEFTVSEPVKKSKQSLQQLRQDAGEQLEILAHDLAHEIEAASVLLRDTMHAVRHLAEGDGTQNTVAYLKSKRQDCVTSLEGLDKATHARTVQLKEKHRWFQEDVFSCNLNGSCLHGHNKK